MLEAEGKRGGCKLAKAEIKGGSEVMLWEAELAISTFRDGFHGNRVSTLSYTRSKLGHRGDTRAFKWPQVLFPKLRYRSL